MFRKLFKSKGLYIVLLIASTLVLAAALFFIFSGRAAISGMPQMTQQHMGDFSQHSEGFNPRENMGERPDISELPEGFELPENFEVPEGFEMPGSAAGMIGPHRLLMVVIIVCLVLDIICIVVLARMRRKGRHSQKDETVIDDDDDGGHKKKSGAGMVLIGLAAVAVIVVALLPEGSTEANSVEVEEELIEGTAELGTITRTLVSGGSINENTEKAVTLAGDIKIENWLVNAGDYVREGQSIARVDRDSVILSIAELIELMDEVDSEIEASRNDVIENAIYAPAAGRIKGIYAQPGVDVQDTISEYSTLMRLSLDGLMAVQLDEADGMYTGMDVAVCLSDGSQIPGQIELIFDGKATVTLPDDKAAYGEIVSVYDTQGRLLGTGSLYIHKEIKITGIAGTVQRLNVEENMLVGTDMALVVLTNTAYSGQRDILTAKRREMEDELNKLFSAYNSGEIYSPCTGRIAAINEDIVAEELANTAAAPTLLSSADPSMESYAVYVSSIDGSMYTLVYTEGNLQTEKEVDLSDVPIFKFVKGNFQPAQAAEIAVGDSLVLGCYVNGDSTVLDHVVIYSIEDNTDAPSVNPGGMGGSGGSSGGFSGSMGGSGSMGRGGGSSGSSYSYQTGTDEEDSYSVSKTILSYITPFDKAELTVSVDELDIVNYYVGQSVDVSLDALPGQSFTGKISRIDPNGENEDGGSTKYSVTVTMERTENMLTGMNATVRATIESRDNVLLVPLAAISEENGSVFIYTAYDKEKDALLDPVDVSTGWSDGENVEILSGLEEGDTYFYRYADTIKYTFQ